MNPREILSKSARQAETEAQAGEEERAIVDQVLIEKFTEGRDLAHFIVQRLVEEGTDTDFRVGEYQKTMLGRQKLIPGTLTGWVISEVGRYFDTSNQSWSSAFGNGLLTDGRYINYHGNSPVVVPKHIVDFRGGTISAPDCYDPYTYSKSQAEIFRRTSRRINNITNHQAEQITRAMSIRDTLDSFGRRKLPPKYYL